MTQLGCLSTVEFEWKEIHYSIDCLLANGEVGQESSRMDYEFSIVLGETKPEHPKHQIKGQQTDAFRLASLSKVFTSNIINITLPLSAPHLQQQQQQQPRIGTRECVGDGNHFDFVGDMDYRWSGGMYGDIYEELEERPYFDFGLRIQGDTSTTHSEWYPIRVTSTAVATAITTNVTTTNADTIGLTWTSNASATGVSGDNHGYWYTLKPNYNATTTGTLSQSFGDHLDRLNRNGLEHLFNERNPRPECCFKPIFAPWDWYNNKVKLGEELEICEQVPTHRIASKEMGVPLDYCKKHFRIALDWHREKYGGAMPNMVRKFTDKELVTARELFRVEQERKIQREKEKLERLEQQSKIKERADLLLRKWLSPQEYNYLQERREIEFPSQYEKDVIYIVKKDANKKVVRKVNNIPVEELCVVPLDYNLTNDDGLLSKILLLRNNEKEFLRLANRYPLLQ